MLVDVRYVNAVGHVCEMSEEIIGMNLNLKIENCERYLISEPLGVGERQFLQKALLCVRKS